MGLNSGSSQLLTKGQYVRPVQIESFCRKQNKYDLEIELYF